MTKWTITTSKKKEIRVRLFFLIIIYNLKMIYYILNKEYGKWSVNQSIRVIISYMARPVAVMAIPVAVMARPVAVMALPVAEVLPIGAINPDIGGPRDSSIVEIVRNRRGKRITDEAFNALSEKKQRRVLRKRLDSRIACERRHVRIATLTTENALLEAAIRLKDRQIAVLNQLLQAGH